MGATRKIRAMASAESEVKEVFTSEISEVTDGGVEDDDFALTEAHIAAIRTMFKEFDKDGSGAIDPCELSDLCTALGDPLTKRELDEAFDHLDMDDNGRIGFDEFISFWRNA